MDDDRKRRDDKRSSSSSYRRSSGSSSSSRHRSSKRDSRSRSRSKSPIEKRERPKKKSLFDMTPQDMANLGQFGGFTPVIMPADNPGSAGKIVGFTGPGMQNLPLTALINPLLVQPQQRIPPQQQTPQQRQARRIYVGNIPRDATEQELVQFFNEAMKKIGLAKTPGDPVVGAQINYDKNFVFLDFRVPEEATSAMNLDGVKMREYILKVRRPNNYVPPTNETSSSGSRPNIPGLISTNVPDTPNKLFIGGLPAQMTEDQVLQLLSNIGTLNAFNLVKDINTGLSKGYAFCEFSTTDATDKAISTLNGVEMGGKKLLVQRASVGAKHGSAPQIDIQASGVSNFLNLAVRIEAALAGLSTSCELLYDPTNVLLLLNCLKLRDVMEDSEYNDVMLDIRAEMSRFGYVKRIIIPRPQPEIRQLYKYDPDDDEIVTHDECASVYGIGRIYVEFDSKSSAEKAQRNVAGRKYQGRTLITSYMKEEEFYSSFEIH